MTFLQIKQRLARRRGYLNYTSFNAETAARYADVINEATAAIAPAIRFSMIGPVFW